MENPSQQNNHRKKKPKKKKNKNKNINKIQKKDRTKKTT